MKQTSKTTVAKRVVRAARVRLFFADDPDQLSLLLCKAHFENVDRAKFDGGSFIKPGIYRECQFCRSN